jgi:hypothetical protein
LQLIELGLLIALLLLVAALVRRVGSIGHADVDLGPVLTGLDGVHRSQDRYERSVRDEMFRHRQESATLNQALRTEVVSSLGTVAEALGGSIETLARSTDQHLDLFRAGVEQRFEAFNTESGRRMDQLTQSVAGATQKFQIEISEQLKEHRSSLQQATRETHELQREQSQTTSSSIQSLQTALDEKHAVFQTTVESRLLLNGQDGHMALASLMKADKIRVVWTTNFDRTIEDAAAQVFGGTGKLTSATLDSAAIALNALNEGRWPILGKLHGDFQSRRLKNTPEELREQDVLLREALIQACGRHGLAVIGYSGRDESVIEALSTAMDASTPFPAGLFWFRRTDQELLNGVSQLAAKAQAKGVAMHLLEVETFDELMADVVNLIPDLPTEITTVLDRRLERVSNAPIPPSGKACTPPRPASATTRVAQRPHRAPRHASDRAPGWWTAGEECDRRTGRRRGLRERHRAMSSTPPESTHPRAGAGSLQRAENPR